MHLIMLLLAIGVAYWIRAGWSVAATDWTNRWQRALNAFLLPPVLLLATGVAILCMGTHSHLWPWAGELSYGLAIAATGGAIGLLLDLTWQAHRTLHQTRAYPAVDLLKTTARLLDTDTLYSAQIGFWRPTLVVSRGLLETLDRPHLEAVLLHEQAHVHYRDTFWFFWLGWLRRLTAWLPQTEDLWQELLDLRELRADRWAAQHTDSLTLAEALLMVVSAATAIPVLGVAFAAEVSPNRLEQRIDALLALPTIADRASGRWLGLLLALLPLLTVPFHTHWGIC